MTKRNPVSAQQNIWFDAEQVDNSDLSLEQQYNTTIQTGIINNHIGTGVLPEVLTQNVLFDSSLILDYLDGIAISTQTQPADNNLGNQLEIELTGSSAAGKRTVKVCIIGLDFNSNLQYETFVFNTNEIQIGIKHFTQILVILFNDLIGDPAISLNLGGTVVIREAKPLTLSRDPIMIAQDIEPNLFFRDFFVSGYLSLQALLQAALPFYNVDTLGIYTAAVDQQVLLNGDITTQIGQKFIATTNNIQKISLLLSARNLETGSETDLAWAGDLVVSIYPLQSSIECPTDIAPSTAIEFSPSNIPISQVSVNYNSLLDMGIVLDSVPQPVDFVFSNSAAAGGNVITVGNYYAFTIKRAGSANKCDILIDVGSDRVTNSRITSFTGAVWVDLPEEDLWFRIFTDAAKVSDGQAYESGFGISLPKTKLDTTTQSTIDYCYRAAQFTGNDVYKAIVSAVTEEGTPVADPRTGQPVNSRQQIVPKIQLLNTIDLANLEVTTEPLIVGAISDKNKKSFDLSNATITAKLHAATMAGEELLIRIVENDDPVRYDSDVTALEANLLNGDLIDAKIIPDASYPNTYYRISEAKLCSMIVGDVNGDGIIDSEDLDLLQTYVGFNLNSSLPKDGYIITDSVTTTYMNGYNTYSGPFVTNLLGLQFQLVDPATNLVVATATDGLLQAHAPETEPRLASFRSLTVNFGTIIGLTNYKLVVFDLSNAANYGAFDIVSSDVNTVVIRKIILSGESIAQMFRADIDRDFAITTNDGYLLNTYINREPYADSIYHTYPAPATNPYTRIGSRFNVIRIKAQKFIDRSDDYSSNPSLRASVIHPPQDIFEDGYTYLQLHNFYSSPIQFSIQKQLTWDENLIVNNSRSKMVPSVFTTLLGFVPRSCSLDGVLCQTYPVKPDFDSGKVDFFVPDNVIIGESGELQRPNGDYYKVDFEVGTIVLEIPNGLYGDERTIDIVGDFIASTEAPEGGGLLTGVTKFGFPAMRFADCSYVTTDSLVNDQIRFSVAVQSFSPNTNGLSEDGYSGVIVDGKMGISIDYATGLLTLNFTNLYQDPVLRTLSTKIQVSVYLKKGGFNNAPLFVDSTKVQNMLKLISVFGGAVSGGPSALVDVETDVEGVLPILHGGTGLNATGPFGTILMSTGGALSYQFIYNLAGVIAFSTGIPDANKIPKTDGYGLLDPSFYYKNPLYIYAVAGRFENDGYSAGYDIGAFTFRFDKFIGQSLESIKLEIILQTTNAANTASLQLYDYTLAGYMDLDGYGGTSLTTISTSPVFLSSADLKSQLQEGATDFLYEIRIGLTPFAMGTEYAICKMARLVITYTNPYAATPPLANSNNFVPYLPV